MYELNNTTGYSGEKTKGVASEIRAFRLIRESHELIGRIADVTSLIQYSGPVNDEISKVDEPVSTPLEGELAGLKRSLERLLLSYRV